MAYYYDALKKEIINEFNKMEFFRYPLVKVIINEKYYQFEIHVTRYINLGDEPNTNVIIESFVKNAAMSWHEFKDNIFDFIKKCETTDNVLKEIINLDDEIYKTICHVSYDVYLNETEILNLKLGILSSKITKLQQDIAYLISLQEDS